MTAGRITAEFAGLRFSHWQVETHAQGVVVVTLDRAGEAVNALSQDVLIELGRLVGAPAAFGMLLTGRALSAHAAHAIGLVDKVVDAPMLLDAAVDLLARPPVRPFGQHLRAWASNTWLARAFLAPMLEKQVARKA